MSACSRSGQTGSRFRMPSGTMGRSASEHCSSTRAALEEADWAGGINASRVIQGRIARTVSTLGQRPDPGREIAALAPQFQVAIDRNQYRRHHRQYEYVGDDADSLNHDLDR